MFCALHRRCTYPYKAYIACLFLCLRSSSKVAPVCDGPEGVCTVGQVMSDIVTDIDWDSLKSAIQEGDLRSVQQLASQLSVAEVEAVQAAWNGVSMLHLAATAGHVQVVRWLTLDRGVETETYETKTPSKARAVHMAAQAGHSTVIEALGKANANLEASIHGGGLQAVHLAAFHGNAAVLEVLMKHRVDMSVRGPGGSTILHAASMKGHVAAVKVLLSQPGSLVSARDSNGETALHVAAKEDHVEIAHLLLSAGADPYLSNDDGVTSIAFAQVRNRELAYHLAGDIKCAIDILDASEIDIQMFETSYQQGKRPLLVKNWTAEWPAHELWPDGGFARKFANHKIPLKLQHIPKGEADVPQVFVSVEDFMAKPANKSLEGMIAFEIGDYSTYATLGKDHQPTPRALQNIMMLPVFTSGRNGTGSSVHHHEEAWVSQVVGTKVWMLAPQKTDPLGRGDDESPCEILRRLKMSDRDGLSPQLQACAAGPRDVIYVPYGWYHGTCNIGDVTVGIGGRGKSDCPDAIDMAHRCDLPGLRKLQTQGADLNAACTTTRLRPLHGAAQSGCIAIVEYLLEKKQGVKEDAQDIDGRYAQDWAAYGGHLDLVKFFANRWGYGQACLGGLRQASLQNQVHIVEHFSKHMDQSLFADASSLAYASRAGSLAIVRMLAANMSASALNGKKLEVPALHMAASHGHVHVAGWLAAKAGVEIEKRDKKGTTALLQAASDGYSDVVAVLAEARANLMARVHKRKLQPVHLAAAAGHTSVLEVLFKHGADISALGPEDNNALHGAVRFGRLSVVKFLVSTSKIPIDARNQEGDTALHLAVQNGHREVAEFLIASKADKSLKNKKGETVATMVSRA